MASSQKLKVLLLVGGDSPESDVSIDSGKSVFHALQDLGHDVLVADPRRPDIRPTEDPSEFFASAKIGTAPPEFGSDRFTARRDFTKTLSTFDTLGCDVVFNALHGGAGEDGTIQAVLDYLGIAYTGCGARACAVAMDKDLSKRVVSRAGVPVAKHIYIDSPAQKVTSIDKKVMDALTFPVVVKPNNEGSSVGVTIVSTGDELEAAIRGAKKFDGPYMIEKFVAGGEITAAVMDGTKLPLLEIRPKDGFYDYRNKYQPGSCEYIVPAPLDDATTAWVASSVETAYHALGCTGYARIDFRLSTSGEHYFLEANTLPGLTANSLFPKAARAAGIDYPDMIERILRLALPADGKPTNVAPQEEHSTRR